MTIPNSKTGRRLRPKPTIHELNEINDKLLQEFLFLYNEIISHAIQKNINIKDDHVSTSLWKCVYSRFYKPKDMQREELRSKQARLKLIPSLEELHGTNDNVLHDLFDQYREKISYRAQENISIEDDHMSKMFCNHICIHL